MVSENGALASSFVPIAAVIFAALAVFVLAPVVIDGAGRFIHQTHVRTRLFERSKQKLLPLLFDDLCRNGIAFLRPCAKHLLRSKGFERRCKVISTTLASRVSTTSVLHVCEIEVALALLIGLFLFVFVGSFPLALTGMFLPFAVTLQYAQSWHRKVGEQLREQLPDALHVLGMSFSAGHSLQQAFSLTARETPEPLGHHLLLTAHDIDVGYSVSEALQRLEKRTNCADLRLVLIALDIQHMTGGSLREILEGTASSIADSFELARSLQVQTAQARLSARIVTIMPLALLVVLSLTMPGYFTTFFSSSSGLALLAFALGLNVLGIFMIRRILGIDME